MARITKNNVMDALLAYAELVGQDTHKDCDCHIYVEPGRGQVDDGRDYLIDLCYGDTVYYGDEAKRPDGSIDTAYIAGLVEDKSYRVISATQLGGTMITPGTGDLYQDVYDHLAQLIEIQREHLESLDG